MYGNFSFLSDSTCQKRNAYTYPTIKEKRTYIKAAQYKTQTIKQPAFRFIKIIPDNFCNTCRTNTDCNGKAKQREKEISIIRHDIANHLGVMEEMEKEKEGRELLKKIDKENGKITSILIVTVKQNSDTDTVPI